MVCSIYDESLIRIGEISVYQSLVWEEAYQDAGECQLVCAISPLATSLLKNERFIGKKDRSTLWQIKSTEKYEGLLWANGFTVNYTLLEDRICNSIITSNNVETTLRGAVNASRPAPIVGLSTLRGLTDVHVSQHTYPSLFNLSQDLCVATDLGFRFIHDRTNHKLLFDVYSGEDRRNVRYSEDYGNLANLALKQSNTGYKNVAYVGGAGEGAERTFVVCGDTDTIGLERHEMFVDARDLSREDGQSLSDYQSILQARGLEKLNEHNAGLSVSFDINPDDFGTRYDIGDTVTALLKSDGLKLYVRIVSARQTYEKNKRKTQITVGTPIIRSGGKK
jgi:hypothetical protein